MRILNVENVCDLIDLHEGTRAKPYLCTSGHLTIGRGRNLDAKGLSPDEIDYLFANDLAAAITDAASVFPSFDKLDEVRKAVLTDMCFNLGKDGISEFKMLRAAVARRDWFAASAHMKDSEWFHQVKDRAPRLMKMMRTGRWPTE